MDLGLKSELSDHFQALMTYQEIFYQFFVYLSSSSGILYFFFSTYPHS